MIFDEVLFFGVCPAPQQNENISQSLYSAYYKSWIVFSCANSKKFTMCWIIIPQWTLVLFPIRKYLKSKIWSWRMEVFIATWWTLQKPCQISCWDDVFVPLVLLNYFYQKCVNKHPACASRVLTLLCLCRNSWCFLARVVAGDDDRDTDLFLCDTNTCKFDGECLRIGDIITCICNFKVRPPPLWNSLTNPGFVGSEGSGVVWQKSFITVTVSHIVTIFCWKFNTKWIVYIHITMRLSRTGLQYSVHDKEDIFNKV